MYGRFVDSASISNALLRNVAFFPRSEKVYDFYANRMKSFDPCAVPERGEIENYECKTL